MTGLSKKDKLWEIWSDGFYNLKGIINSERGLSLIPMSLTTRGQDECIMSSDLGKVPLTIAEVSKYGIIKDDQDSLYKYAIYKLLKSEYKLNLLMPDSNEKIEWKQIDNESDVELFEEQRAQMEEIKNKSTYLVFVEGKEKVGKTTLIKSYCFRTLGHGKSAAYYLDFNRGYFDFCDFINEFSALPSNGINRYTIFLDHLYCCDLETAEHVLDFFRKLAEVLKKKHINIKVIVSETSNRKFKASKQENTVFLNSSMKKDKALFEQEVSKNNLSKKELRLLYKILTLSRVGIQVILDSEEKTVLLKKGGLFEKVSGMTVHKDIFNPDSCIVSFFNFDTARLMQEYLEENFAEQVGKRQKQKICRAYLLEYSDISTLRSLLGNFVDRNLKLKEDDDTFLQDYLYLIKYCTDCKKKIVEDINKSPDDKILDNHLGKILFALETIVGIKAKSWDDQRAIIKIKTLVRNMYFISKEVALPNINYQYIDKEKTVEDFFTAKDQDSIRTQIELQDLLSNNYDFDIKNATETPERTEEFAYYLPEIQEKARFVDNYGEFFQTYLLALLIEFESTLYHIDPNEERLKMLLDRACQRAKYSKDTADDTAEENNCCYFYPARVPWVTGRMHSAVSIFLQTGQIDENVNKLKLDMERWLKKTAYEIDLEGEKCCLWCSGTGNWNTVLDTTILCMSAMKYNEKECFDKAKKYIRKRRSAWLTPGNLSSGISALEILSDTIPAESIHNLRKEIESLISKEHDDIDENKSDPAMGESQIAQKLVDLCMKYKDQAASTLSQRLYEEEKYEGINQSFGFLERTDCFKIGISYAGENKEKYVELIYEQLLQKGYKKEEIFVDFWHSNRFNGTNGEDLLIEIYREKCECVVALLSKEYANKMWTRKEWPTILELSRKSCGQRVCLLKVGKFNIADIWGLDSKTVVEPIDNKTIDWTANFVDEAYQRAVSWIRSQQKEN